MLDEPKRAGTPTRVAHIIRVLEILKAHGMDMRPEAHVLLAPVQNRLGKANFCNNYLRSAIEADCAPVVKWILDNTGLDVNIKLDSRTPSYLFGAVEACSLGCVRLLLAAGAHPVSDVCETVSQYAARLASTEHTADQEYQHQLAGRTAGHHGGHGGQRRGHGGADGHDDRSAGKGGYSDVVLRFVTIAEVLEQAEAEWRDKHAGDKAPGHALPEPIAERSA